MARTRTTVRVTTRPEGPSLMELEEKAWLAAREREEKDEVDKKRSRSPSPPRWIILRRSQPPPLKPTWDMLAKLMDNDGDETPLDEGTPLQSGLRGGKKSRSNYNRNRRRQDSQRKPRPLPSLPAPETPETPEVLRALALAQFKAENPFARIYPSGL